MKVIDLGRALEDSMQVFPGDDAPVVERLDSCGCRSKKLTLSTHTGTHMDAPAHMLRSGVTLDALAPESFFGFGFIIDVSGCAGRKIEPADLGLSAAELSAADFLLLRTGFDAKFGTEAYFKNFPVLSARAASFLAEQELKGVGVDAISVDYVESADSPVHQILLGAGLVIIENLTGLDRLPYKEPFCLTALPMSIKEADGAPARVMAVLEN
ncbi:MAG: cyclase family protein [Cloacibacillus sp.]